MKTFDETYSKNKVIGKAIYLELDAELAFGSNRYVTVRQFIVFPDSMLDGAYLPISRAERTLSFASSSSRWSIYTSEILNPYITSSGVGGKKEFAKVDISEAEPFAEQQNKTLISILGRYLERDWNIVKQPIAIEVSENDIALVRNEQIPQAVVRRVMRSRKALEFPPLDRIKTAIAIT